MNQLPPLDGLTLAEVQRCLLATPLEALDIRILMGHALALSRVQLITQSERVLTAAEAGSLSDLLQRRLAGEPVAYLVGQREFYGLAFQVTPDVLIPRPETELLVELALERLPQRGRMLDLGTGSGAIAIAIAHQRPDAQITALDASAAALAVAQANAERLLPGRPPLRFLQSDWYAGLNADAGFDLIVSNPPYIAAGDAHLAQGDLRFEPVDALTDHGDGLSAYRCLVSGAPRYLAAGGWLLFEHGYDQAAEVGKLLINQGFQSVQHWRDLAGLDRVTGAKWLA